MKGTILLNSNECTNAVEEEEKSRFVRSILEIMEVPINDIWLADEELSVKNKIQLRSLLSSYSIKIVDLGDGTLEIYVEDKLVGKWNKCTYKLKTDLSELDPNRRLYLEMSYDFWSIFEDEK